MGCLAIPYGFNECGYQLALAMLALSAMVTYFCCWMMTETQRFYGSQQVKSFSDLGRTLYGSSGFTAVFVIYYLNQYCTCVSYVIFFLGTFKEHFSDVEPHLVGLGLTASLVFLSLTLRSMKDI